MVPSGTGKGSSDIVRVIYSILLFPVLLFSFILAFVIVTFWAEKKNTMVYRCVSECAGRSFLVFTFTFYQSIINESINNTR